MNECNCGVSQGHAIGEHGEGCPEYRAAPTDIDELRRDVFLRKAAPVILSGIVANGRLTGDPQDKARHAVTLAAALWEALHE